MIFNHICGLHGETMDKKNLIRFDNTYATLPENFYTKVSPAKVHHPKLLLWNEALAEQLGFTKGLFSNEELAKVFSGQQLLESSIPLAMTYAGHQFGHFVPQLGDGRAILLGELLSPTGHRHDIQLKGAGITPYSRNGDGLAALGPILREYIVSEAMFHLGVPTTRALAAVSTEKLVYRDTVAPGAILTRVASSHIRIGHFEYFAARRDIENLKILAGYSIHRHFPEIENSSDLYLLFFQKVVAAQARLIAHWMDIGFIHGVMNTDNMLISGETLDYGPCAFMDDFNFNQVFSSIDKGGRYAYINQATVAQWNLARLADCLLPLMESDSSRAVQLLENELSNFIIQFEEHWLKRMRLKLGFLTAESQDYELIKKWLEYLHAEKLDYTSSFQNLANLLSLDSMPSGFKKTSLFKDFELLWRQRLKVQPFDNTAVKLAMAQVNPIYIPRNHQIERAIQGALSEDLSIFHEMVEMLKNPFLEQNRYEIYKQPPRPEERVHATFCGT